MKHLSHLAYLIVFVLSSQAEAFRFSPMVVDFQPTGSQATQVLTIENPGDDKLPVQIEVFARSANSKGEEVRVKTEDFVVFPEQVVLLPKEKRNVRVSFVGKITEGREKAYRFVASQLPIEFKEKNSEPQKNSVNLKFLLQYVASAYVTPEGALPDIKIKEVKRLSSKKVSVTFVNQGKAHKVLLFNQFKISSGDKVLLDVKTKKEIESVNLLPGDSAIVAVETALEVPGDQPLTGSIVLRDDAD